MLKLSLLCAAAALAAAPASLSAQDKPNEPPAGARQRALVTLPDNPEVRRAREDFNYADAVLYKDTAYLSGVIAIPRPGDATLEATYDRAFERVGARLAKVGCTWDDVVDMTSYHTDLKAQIEPMAAVIRRVVRPPYVAWTAVGVTELATPSGITEIKVIARDCTRPKS